MKPNSNSSFYDGIYDSLSSPTGESSPLGNSFLDKMLDDFPDDPMDGFDIPITPTPVDGYDEFGVGGDDFNNYDLDGEFLTPDIDFDLDLEDEFGKNIEEPKDLKERYSNKEPPENSPTPPSTSVNRPPPRNGHNKNNSTNRPTHLYMLLYDDQVRIIKLFRDTELKRRLSHNNHHRNWDIMFHYIDSHPWNQGLWAVLWRFDEFREFNRSRDLMNSIQVMNMFWMMFKPPPPPDRNNNYQNPIPRPPPTPKPEKNEKMSEKMKKIINPNTDTLVCRPPPMKTLPISSSSSSTSSTRSTYSKTKFTKSYYYQQQQQQQQSASRPPNITKNPFAPKNYGNRSRSYHNPPHSHSHSQSRYEEEESLESDDFGFGVGDGDSYQPTDEFLDSPAVMMMKNESEMPRAPPMYPDPDPTAASYNNNIHKFSDLQSEPSQSMGMAMAMGGLNSNKKMYDSAPITSYTPYAPSPQQQSISKESRKVNVRKAEEFRNVTPGTGWNTNNYNYDLLLGQDTKSLDSSSSITNTDTNTNTAATGPRSSGRRGNVVSKSKSRGRGHGRGGGRGRPGQYIRTSTLSLNDSSTSTHKKKKKKRKKSNKSHINSSFSSSSSPRTPNQKTPKSKKFNNNNNNNERYGGGGRTEGLNVKIVSPRLHSPQGMVQGRQTYQYHNNNNNTQTFSDGTMRRSRSTFQKQKQKPSHSKRRSPSIPYPNKVNKVNKARKPVRKSKKKKLGLGFVKQGQELREAEIESAQFMNISQFGNKGKSIIEKKKHDKRRKPASSVKRKRVSVSVKKDKDRKKQGSMNYSFKNMKKQPPKSERGVYVDERRDIGSVSNEKKEMQEKGVTYNKFNFDAFEDNENESDEEEFEMTLAKPRDMEEEEDEDSESYEEQREQEEKKRDESVGVGVLLDFSSLSKDGEKQVEDDLNIVKMKIIKEKEKKAMEAKEKEEEEEERKEKKQALEEKNRREEKQKKKETEVKLKVGKLIDIETPTDEKKKMFKAKKKKLPKFVAFKDGVIYDIPESVKNREIVRVQREKDEKKEKKEDEKMVRMMENDIKKEVEMIVCTSLTGNSFDNVEEHLKIRK